MNEVERRGVRGPTMRGRKHAATFVHGAVRLARIDDIGEKGRGNGGEGAGPVATDHPACLGLIVCASIDTCR